MGIPGFKGQGCGDERKTPSEQPVRHLSQPFSLRKGMHFSWSILILKLIRNLFYH